MWEDLMVIADRLDRSGLYKEADEIDMILSMAALPGGKPFSKFRELLDTPEKKNIFKRLFDALKGKTFTREDVYNLMEQANELAEQSDVQTYRSLRDDATQIAGAIKELTNAVIKLRDGVKSGPRNERTYNAYIEDIMRLANNLVIFNRMLSGARGPQDTTDALRIKEMAGGAIDKAQSLVKEFYNDNLSKFDWSLFPKIVDKWNKLIAERSETSRLMAEEQKEKESIGVKFDPRDSKYAPTLKKLETFDTVVRKDAKEIMSYYDIMAMINPEGAKKLESQLGNTFTEVKKLSREALRD